jgi:PST family polysaccharide transporter
MLARLLGPSAYGVIAVSWLIISIGQLFSDFGFISAIVQKTDLTDNEINFAFTAQIIIGSVLTLICIIISVPIAQFFNIKGQELIIAVMGSIFFLRSLGQISTGILNRKLDFKSTQIGNIGSYVVGYIFLGIPCALNDFGPWSLVIAQVCQTFLNSIYALVKCGFHFKINFKSESQILYFGSQVLIANIISWTILNIDSVIIGRYFSATILGVYNRAMTLVGMPINSLTASLQSVLFSACSRLGSNKTSLRSIFLSVVEGMALLSFPIVLTMAVLSETIVLGLYGSEWSGIIIILPPLCLALGIHSVLALVGPILMSQNQTHREVNAQILTLIIALPVFYYASNHNIEVFSWCVLLIYFIRAIFLFAQITKLLEINMISIIKLFIWPVIIAISNAFLVFILNFYIPMFNNIFKLIIDILASIVICLCLVRVFGPYIFSGEFGRQLLQIPSFPLVARRWMRVA